MRIIAGQWRGRPLVAPSGTATRPTADRVREALFSMLASRLGTFEGLVVADLFAGSGAAGLEALSRGTARCTFAETDRNAVDALRSNIAALGAGERAEVRVADATRLAGGPFDLVIADAPYGSGLGQKAVAHLGEIAALSTGCLVSLESGRDEDIVLPGLTELADRTYGQARVKLFRA